MNDLFRRLCAAVAARSENSEVAILLSAGMDSLSVLLALRELGKKIQAYTYEVEGHPSAEREKVEYITHRVRVPLRTVTVPTSNLAFDFLRLAVEHRCRKKVQV